MKIRIFRTKERSTTPVWEVTLTGLRQITVDVDQNTAEDAAEDATLDNVVTSLDDGILGHPLHQSTRIVSHSMASSVEHGNTYLYHSFLLRE